MATPKPACSTDHPQTSVRKQDRAEEQCRERGAEHQHGDVRPAEVGDAEQIEVECRRLGVPLMDDEDREHDQSCAKDAEGSGAEPSELFGADQAVGEQPGGAGDEDDADGGRDLGVGVGRLVQVPAPGDHGVDADGEVDEERPPPPEPLDDRRAERGAEGAGDGPGRAPDRDGSGSWSWAKACITNANDDGISAAAPTAWTMRNTISSSALGARPHAIEATVNTVEPARKTFRCPTRSASLPAGMSIAANTIV